MSIKIISAFLSVIFSLAIFVPYYLSLWQKKAEPHLLTWTTWWILTGLGFILSYTHGGGAGSLIFGVQFCLNFSIVIYCLIKKEKNIVPIDWLIFAGAMITLIFYIFTAQAAIAALLAATIDVSGFLPTFRKSYRSPSTEPALTYAFSFFSYLLSLAALQTYSFTTLIYPILLLTADATFVIFLLVRRKIITKQKGVRAAAVIIKNNQILLIHRFWRGKEYFVAPGGGAEAGETPEQAAIREAKEETNLDVKIKKELFKEYNYYDNRMHYYFLVDEFSGNVELGGEEAKRNSESDTYILEWHDLKKVDNLPFLPENMKKSLINCLNEFTV